MSLPSHKTLSWSLPIKYFLEFGRHGSGLHDKFLFLGSKDAGAESLLIPILVSLFWRSVTFINVDTKWLHFILMQVQFSVLYLKVPVTHVCELFKCDTEKRYLNLSKQTCQQS